MNVEQGANSPNRDTAEKKSRIFFITGYAFLIAMALFWSVDSSIVYIFLGIACFFLFLGFNARPRTVVRSESKSYRSQYQREYQTQREQPVATESVEDKIKQIFQRTSSPRGVHPTDAMAKGRKIAMAIGIGFFVLFAVPFVVALFGSDDFAESRFYYALAQNHFDTQQYDSAYIEYKRALALDPEYTEAMVGYGRVLSIRDERDSAILIFDRALEIDPDYSDATYRKAQVWYDQKKFSEATGILTPLLIDEPQNYNAMLLMGDCYYAQDNFVDALSWYENAYQNAEMRSSILCYLMGYMYEIKQENARAIELYKEALTYDDTIADIYDRLGRLVPGDEGNAYRAKAIELQKN